MIFLVQRRRLCVFWQMFYLSLVFTSLALKSVVLEVRNDHHTTYVTHMNPVSV